jgi:hypothetical protein
MARWVDRAAGAGLDTETMVGMLRSVVNEAGTAQVSDGIVA